MSKRSELPQSPRHVYIYDEDWDFITAHFGPHSAKPVGVSFAIRTMIHSQVKRLRARAQAVIDEQSSPRAVELEDSQ